MSIESRWSSLTSQATGSATEISKAGLAYTAKRHLTLASAFQRTRRKMNFTAGTDIELIRHEPETTL